MTEPLDLQVRCFVRSHVGCVRANNEDACAVSTVEGRVTDWNGAISRDGGWALLADGVGGHVAGDVAASLAIEVLRPLMSQIRNAGDVQRAVNLADEAIFMAMEMRPELHGMGTTIAGVVIRSEAALAFNAGDSRIYAFENGELRQISIDDTTKSGALMQCLGGYQEPAPIYVHTQRIASSADLLLCSDGVTDMLADEQIATVLCDNLNDPARSLIEAAIAAGGHDNASAVFVTGR